MNFTNSKKQEESKTGFTPKSKYEHNKDCK